jgi:hypothetical protein
MIGPTLEYFLLRLRALCPEDPVVVYLIWSLGLLAAALWLCSLWPKHAAPDTHGRNTRGEGQYDGD